MDFKTKQKMKEKENKYFMAGTDEEVLIGDVINVELVKDFEDGRTLTREVEFKLTEETIPLALEMGIIEEHEEEKVKKYVFEGKFTEEETDDDEELVDFDDNEGDEFDFRKCVAQDIDEIRDILKAHLERMGALEKNVEEFKESYSKFLAKFYVDKAKEKAASSKKK